VVEDLITVLVLVLMPALTGQSQTSPALAIVLALAKVAALTIFTIVVGGRTIPWLLTRVLADAVARAVHARSSS
jgi:predicted Kef-type K+ transport protein